MELKKNRLIRQLYYTYLNFRNKHSYCVGKRNKITVRGTRIASRFQIQGDDNQIIILTMGCVKNAHIYIQGNRNKIIIKEGALVSGAELWVEDNDCTIEIGMNTFIGHHSHLACTENGSNLIIGNDCMLSSYVKVRTGDSHSILDMDGKRINKAQSIIIGDHCWIGEGAKILKGVSLDCNVIVSTGTIVTKSFRQKQIIGGIPAKVIKDNVSWDSKRL